LCVLADPRAEQDEGEVEVLHEAVRALLYPTQPKALFSGRQKGNQRARAQEQALNDITFEVMGVGSMAVIENEFNCPDSVFKVKFGNKLSPCLSLVKIVKRDLATRKLFFQFYKPVAFTTTSSRYISLEAATRPGSFEAPEGEEWLADFDFPNDDDIAGITVGAWDPEDGDSNFPKSEYAKVQSTIQHNQADEAQQRGGGNVGNA
jgi:hypothetical protein